MKRSLAYLLIPLLVLFLASVFFAYHKMRRWRAVPENPKEGPIKADTEVEVTGFRNYAVVLRALERCGSTGPSQP